MEKLDYGSAISKLLAMHAPYDAAAIAEIVRSTCDNDAPMEKINAKWGSIFITIRDQIEMSSDRRAWLSRKQAVYTALQRKKTSESDVIRNTVESAMLQAVRQAAAARNLTGTAADDFVDSKFKGVNELIDATIAALTELLHE